MQLADPRYTGANRCWPCTTVNVVLVASVAALVSFAGYWMVGAVIVCGGILSIARYGYVVPGTPAFTRRLPESVLVLFGNRSVEPAVDRALSESLDDADVLASADGEVRLDERFEEEYSGRAREYAADRDALEAWVVQTFPAVHTVSVARALGGGETWFGQDAAGNTLIQWEARAPVAMDVAGAELLADSLDRWTDADRDEQSRVLALLRAGARTCPTCDGPFTRDSGPDLTCCGGRSFVGLGYCGSCGYSVVDGNDLPREDA